MGSSSDCRGKLNGIVSRISGAISRVLLAVIFWQEGAKTIQIQSFQTLLEKGLQYSPTLKLSLASEAMLKRAAMDRTRLRLAQIKVLTVTHVSPAECVRRHCGSHTEHLFAGISMLCLTPLNGHERYVRG